MNAITKSFAVAGAILLTDSPDDTTYAQTALRMQAATFGADGLAQQIGDLDVLVVTETEADGIERVNDLIASGIAAKRIRFVDTGYGVALRNANIDDLRVRFRTPKDFLWEHTRPMSGWPEDPPLITVSTMIDGLDTHARLTFPEVVTITGGYGSGKSSIAQMMALKIAHHYGMPVSVIAWEDRRRGFRERLWRTAIGASMEESAEQNIDCHAAVELERRVIWTEPLKVDDRTIVAQFARMRYLTEVHGVKAHVLDPWNEFDHDTSGEQETTYIRRIMMEAAKLTRDLGVVFFLVTHLPKSGYTESGKIKPFRIINAAGSAEFGNKSDHGFCIARTTILSNILRGTVDHPDFEPEEIGRITREHGQGLVEAGVEHVILATDKVKVEPDMGRRGVQAYVLDKSKNDLVLDPAATQVVKRLWDVF